MLAGKEIVIALQQCLHWKRWKCRSNPTGSPRSKRQRYHVANLSTLTAATLSKIERRRIEESPFRRSTSEHVEAYILPPRQIQVQLNGAVS
jgi:hypothetical protein